MSRSLLVVLAAFLMSLGLAACVIDGTAEVPGAYSCNSDADCVEGYTCESGLCQPAGGGGPGCTDEDQDGFGVGDTSACPSCTGPAANCLEDCNDNDATVNPGTAERCDGKDNDCDASTPDGQVSCESSSDCPPQSGVVGSCPDGTCVYQPPTCPTHTATCTNGSFDIPEC